MTSHGSRCGGEHVVAVEVLVEQHLLALRSRQARSAHRWQRPSSASARTGDPPVPTRSAGSPIHQRRLVRERVERLADHASTAAARAPIRTSSAAPGRRARAASPGLAALEQHRPALVVVVQAAGPRRRRPRRAARPPRARPRGADRSASGRPACRPAAPREPRNRRRPGSYGLAEPQRPTPRRIRRARSGTRSSQTPCVRPASATGTRSAAGSRATAASRECLCRCARSSSAEITVSSSGACATTTPHGSTISERP